jgi:two-component system cell cycle sensor histidine kinase/response regulator CckA
MQNRTVLVVEDDQETLFVLSRALAAGGFDVMWARNAEHALQLLSRHRQKIDLLLTDVVLPGLSGPAFVDRAKQLYSQIHAVYVSAYDQATIRSHGVDPERTPFLPKPCEPAELLRLVAEVLERADKSE